jgi:hypothetical protein
MGESTSEQFAEMGAQASERLRSAGGDLDRRLRDLVNERPLTCLLVAVLGGYAIARLTR